MLGVFNVNAAAAAGATGAMLLSLSAYMLTGLAYVSLVLLLLLISALLHRLAPLLVLVLLVVMLLQMLMLGASAAGVTLCLHGFTAGLLPAGAKESSYLHPSSSFCTKSGCLESTPLSMIHTITPDSVVLLGNFELVACIMAIPYG